MQNKTAVTYDPKGGVTHSSVLDGRPKLLDSIREAMRARHYSRRTEEAYAMWLDCKMEQENLMPIRIRRHAKRTKRQKWLSWEGLLQQNPVWHRRVMRVMNECFT